MVTHMATKRILIFLAFAFGIPWVASLVFYLSGMIERNPNQALMLLNYIFIFTPAPANLATRLITREGWKKLWLWPNFKRGWKFYLAVWLLPLLAAVPGSLIYYLIFPQAFDPSAARALRMMSIFTSVSAGSPWTIMLFLMVENMLIFAPINAIFSIGEEFGWRAYLLQKLMYRFGSARNAAVLVGLVWGVWHMPLIYLGYANNVGVSASSRDMILFMLMYPISTTLTSILLSWATLRSGSMWPAALGHATELGVGGIAMGMLKGPFNLLVSPNPQSLIGNLGYIALALVLYFNRKAFSHAAFAGEKATVAEKAPAVAGAQ